MPDSPARTLEDAANPIEQLLDILGKDLEAVDCEIRRRMDSSVPLISELASYLVAAGGKRLRPLLTLASSALCGYEGRRHIGLAAAVEFIHTATLLHDDVVDESTLRRSRSTANSLWGNSAPVLVGDFLFSRAFQLMVADGSLRVLDTLAQSSSVIAEGEIDQLMSKGKLSTNRRHYLGVVSAKTAALFRAAARVGALVAGVDEDRVEALSNYGQSLGIAFQLSDDALDYDAEAEDLGKNPGDDFFEGKLTLPLIIALEKASAKEKNFLRRTVEKGEMQEGDFGQALALVRRHKGLEKTRAFALEYAEAASKSLASFPQSPLKNVLLKLPAHVALRST